MHVLCTLALPASCSNANAGLAYLLLLCLPLHHPTSACLLQAQCWFNEARTRKPQTFATAASEAAAFDTTNGGEHCDFCR